MHPAPSATTAPSTKHWTTHVQQAIDEAGPPTWCQQVPQRKLPAAPARHNVVHVVLEGILLRGAEAIAMVAEAALDVALDDACTGRVACLCVSSACCGSRSLYNLPGAPLSHSAVM